MASGPSDYPKYTPVAPDGTSLVTGSSLNTTGGTGGTATTEFAEDSPAADGALGTLILVVRKDVEGTNVSANGDYATLQTDSLGRLRVATGAGYSEDAVALDGDRGLFVLAMRHDADTTTVSADGDYSAIQVDANGRVKVDNPRPSTGTPTSVANATSNTSLLAANSARRGATVFNDDTAGTGATLKIALGFTASATAFTYACPPQGYYEVPYGFTGAINAIASAATGNARVWEGTP
jgi:hypothetical protein